MDTRRIEDSMEDGGTWRLRTPIFNPSRISRASSLWPTSSKASVASWPPTSRRTSSPPLCTISVSISCPCNAIGLLRTGARRRRKRHRRPCRE